MIPCSNHSSSQGALLSLFTHHHFFAYNPFMPPLALVTGSAHRLGKAFALSLARQGYALVLHYNHAESEAQQTADEIRALGASVYLAQADLTQPNEIQALISNLDSILLKEGQLEFKALVNSAAVMQRSNIDTLSLEDWDSTFALNVRAPFALSKSLSTRMTQGGLIVNVTDIGAQKAWSGYPAYTVSKSALESLTRVLARALAPRIRVNAIAPGLILQPKLESNVVSTEQWDKLVNRLPLKRAATLNEVTSALEFLLKNEYITGQTIVVDGGYSLI
jgi:NAD(P)-dependent dehydrogenase (short-subunit alcohol dehydrogenase family)